MNFVRFILIVVLAYYLVKMLGRWIFSAPKGERIKGKKGRPRGTDYRHLTDQDIEDADYEELKREDDR